MKSSKRNIKRLIVAVLLDASKPNCIYMIRRKIKNRYDMGAPSEGCWYKWCDELVEQGVLQLVGHEGIGSSVYTPQYGINGIVFEEFSV